MGSEDFEQKQEEVETYEEAARRLEKTLQNPEMDPGARDFAEFMKDGLKKLAAEGNDELDKAIDSEADIGLDPR